MANDFYKAPRLKKKKTQICLSLIHLTAKKSTLFNLQITDLTNG